MDEEKVLGTEIGRHLMQPENYGQLEDANCTGVAVDHGAKTYVIMYIKRKENKILDVMFGTNASQDVTTLGSIFTEMIKGEELKSVNEIILELEKEIKNSVELSENTSPEYQDKANMVILAFQAAMRHYERQQEGIEEERFELSLIKACPSSVKTCQMA